MHPRYCIECARINPGECRYSIIRKEEANIKHQEAIDKGLLLPDMEYD